MARLLPPLHEVSLQHPEPLIQGLAGDLRSVIATHGAYRPEGLPAGSGPERNDAARDGNAPPPPGDRSHPPATATRPAAETTTLHTNPLPPPPPGPTGGPQAHVGPLKSVDARTASPTAATRPCRPGPLPEPPRAFSDWLLEACDPDVPTRAVALRRLTRMVTERLPAALQAEERVLVVGGEHTPKGVAA